MARRHLLIGGGPGAIAAAEAIRGADAGAEIVLVSVDPHGYYSRPGLAYYLAKEIPEKALRPFSAKEFTSLGFTSLTDRAVGIDPAGHTVTLQDGGELAYDRLLIATGSTAVPARVAGTELDGVLKLDDLDDARDIIRRSATAKNAVVVGGGITALEIVEGLRAHGVHVDYFMRQDRYWRNVLSENESRVVEEELRTGGVRVHQFTELARIVGRDGRVVAAETGDGTQIPCDLVAVAIGVRPRIEFAKAAGLACERGILVDQYLRTSEDDIFASGDVAETANPVTGRRTLEVLWHSAVHKGRVAGLNMATEPVHAYEEGPSLNVTRLAGLNTTIIGAVGTGKDADLEGLSRGDSQTWSELGEAVLVEAHADGARIRLEIVERAVVGAVVMGEQTLSFPLQELIEARADISSVAPRLKAPGAPVAELIGSCWREWTAQRV
ncbi:MAG TPA: FAD-dependent oxidoreductase [Thermoleophilia bacterium]|nr:FAD-dependent oxidoreductase [Thermoleophilia bacterium]